MKSVPFITDSIDPKVSTNRKFVSRYVNSNFEYGDELAKYLLANGVRKISIFKTDNQYLDALVNGIKEAAKGKLEMEELANISPSDIDLKFLLPKVKKVKSGAFGLFLLPGQLSTFGKTFASDLKNQMIFGGDFIDSEAEVIASGGALEGTIFANNIVEKKFIEKYYTKHKNKAQLKFAAEGYDVANLIADKLCTESELLSGVQILEKLYNKSEARVGALGNTKFIQTETDDKYWTAPIGIFKASKNGSVLIQE